MDSNLKKVFIFWGVIFLAFLSMVFSSVFKPLALLVPIFYLVGVIGANFFMGKYYVTAKNRIVAFIVLFPTVVVSMIVIGLISFIIGNQLEKQHQKELTPKIN